VRRLRGVGRVGGRGRIGGGQRVPCALLLHRELLMRPPRRRGARARGRGLRRRGDGDRGGLGRDVGRLARRHGDRDRVVRTRPGESGLEGELEIPERGRLDVEIPVEVGAHLALHLVDLAEGEHALADDAPGLVAVRVVADHLAGDHECGQEEAVPRGSASGREALLEALQQIEGGEGDGFVETGAMEGISDESMKVARVGEGVEGCMLL
jgi:hypothetical protein